jgi:hypothetical protein
MAGVNSSRICLEKHGHRPRGNDVRIALQILDIYGVQSRRPKKKKERFENYEVPGPDWLWCLDGHDKLAKYDIEIYACVDAFSLPHSMLVRWCGYHP